MSTSESLPKLRPVGLLERFSTARHHLNFYYNVGASACYSSNSPLENDNLKSIIYRAMGLVVAEHPVLTAIPVDEDKGTTYFARLPQIDLSKAVIFVQAKNPVGQTGQPHVQELDAVLEEQHNKDYKESYGELPFWRLTILHYVDQSTDFVASFVYHHALADGTSGLAFHRSFHAALNKVMQSHSTKQNGSTGIDMNPILHTSDTSMLPPLEQLHPLPLSIPFLLKEQWNDWFPKQPPGLWTGQPIISSPSRPRAHLHSLYFPLRTTQTLLSLSRTNSTTLSGTLETIIAAAVFFNLSANHDNLLWVNGAMSLRRFLPPQTITPDSIGVYVSRYAHTHRCPVQPGTNRPVSSPLIDLFSWDETRRVRTSIEAELDRNGSNTVTGLLRWVSNIHGFFTKKLGKARDVSFEFSNVGVFKPRVNLGEEVGEQWKVGRVVFSQGADVVGAPFEASIATGGDGGLNISFSWLDGAVEGGFMLKVGDSTKELIGVLTKEGQHA